MIDVTVYRADDGWRWRAQTFGNHEIVASGEAYERRVDAEHVVQLIFGAREPVDLFIDDPTGKVRTTLR